MSKLRYEKICGHENWRDEQNRVVKTRYESMDGTVNVLYGYGRGYIISSIKQENGQEIWAEYGYWGETKEIRIYKIHKPSDLKHIRILKT